MEFSEEIIFVSEFHSVKSWPYLSHFMKCVATHSSREPQWRNVIFETSVCELKFAAHKLFDSRSKLDLILNQSRHESARRLDISKFLSIPPFDECAQCAQRTGRLEKSEANHSEELTESVPVSGRI